VISSEGGGSFTIQLGNLEPIFIPLVAQIAMVEMSLASNDEEGCTIVTRRKPRKPKHAQAPPLHRRKRQGKKKNPRHIRSKKRSKTKKRQEIQLVDLLEQELLVPITLEEFFPAEFLIRSPST